MQTYLELKESETPPAPLLLFDCTLADGSTHHWSTQELTVNGIVYEPRVYRNNLFEIQTATDQGVDSIPKVTVELANADSVFSELERTIGFKGGKLVCSFVFFDLAVQAAASDPLVLFLGMCNSPESITERTIRITAINRLSAQRVVLPALRVQRRCAWTFPSNSAERAEALNGGSKGDLSRFYPCGYSADIPGGVGNLSGGAAFTSCGHLRADCEARGMFNMDGAGRTTARFSGIEFVPSTITVRSAGEKGSHLSPVDVNEARYNDFVPMVYGTAWYTPSIVFARNDGNLTRIEVLLGVGEMQAIHKVLVSDIEIPQGRSGLNMTGTGWFNVVTPGTRSGAFNRDFTNGSGVPLGDPYGGMALLSVVVPNRVNDGKSMPEIKVLADGIKVSTYTADGTRQPKGFSKNPCWIILDILLRNGWSEDEIELLSFAAAAAYCDEQIAGQDPHGNSIQIPRYQCNLVLKSRRSAGDVLRGIRNASRLFLTFGVNGRLQLRVENTLALQQPALTGYSNAKAQLDGGWPAYEFSDGSQSFSGILRNSDGSSTLKLSCRGSADTPNRFSVEFQDAFNEYQQDSYSLSDPDDIAQAGQEISATPAVLGLPHFNQAARTLLFLLSKSVEGNLQVEFQTSVKALGITPGDIISLTYLKEGFERQPFRVSKVAPGTNFRTATITAQIHDDAWYSDVIVDQFGSGRRLPSANLGVPRPISGVKLSQAGDLVFDVTETAITASDGTGTVLLDVDVAIPPAVSSDAPSIPIIGLGASYAPLTGGVTGGGILYYAVSGVDANGNEGLLSFVVRAAPPSTALTYSVTLGPLSFSSQTVSFHVYRGISPLQLNRIASAVVLSTSFNDTGLASLPQLPPDTNFHHSTIYWRLEAESAVNAVNHSPMSVGNPILRMLPNSYAGFAVHVIEGTGSGQERVITSNTQTDVTLAKPWDIEPDANSLFAISQAAFQIGATGQANRFQFEVPNRENTIVQLLGRSANAAGMECPAEISPLTRWKIGGTGTHASDSDIPGAPLFALTLGAGLNGNVELGAVGFTDLTNTSTVTAGTLSLYYQDELSTAAAITLAVDLSDTDTAIQLSATASIKAGTVLRIQQELLRITSIDAAGALTADRAQFGTNAASFAAGESVVALLVDVVTVSFIKNFFGTPASGDWTFTIPLENTRISAAELFVTNSQGNGPATAQAYTQTLDRGLRTLSGGQYSFQVSGPLAVQDFAAPDVVMEADHVIGDITAYLSQAPAGGVAQVQLTVNLATIATLDFADGSAVSTGIRGAGLAALRLGDRLNVNVTSIGSVLPGTDLTVVVRI